MATQKLKKTDNIDYRTLKGFEKAAILVNYLGKDAAKVFFKNMDEADLKKLLATMNRLRIVPIEVTKKVLEEFYELVSESEDYIFSEKVSSKETIIEALGEDKARGIVGHLDSANRQGRTLESLELVDSKSLVNFLINEHPQTIAVILAHLEIEKRGDVLKRLPESLQGEVVLRLANLDHVSPELLAEVDKVLKNELSNVGTVDNAQLGGVQVVAEMINMLDKNTEQAILAVIEDRDKEMADEIRKLMFVFEDVSKIDDRGIQLLLKEVPNDRLLLALKTANEEIKTKVFNNISKRAAEMLSEDLASMGPVKVADVESAQLEIVNIARRLETEGKIAIARGGSEDVFV
ncbi:MAG: flagellar motor switch protein FliG [Bdellovibrionaceae bacterium]|nr:flagellar motor switch protein FliG [Pseudobdellovibrionaceae bacterium]